MAKLTQEKLIMEYYEAHPNKEVPHADIVDWATSEWLKRTGKVFRDPDRQIRKLHSQGVLQKMRKGVYLYNPENVRRELDSFTAKQKAEIMKRGRYRCAVCGKGRKDGVELQIDHIRPRELGGKSETSNGQILCGQHNYMKKTYKQTETGKQIFISLHKLAQKEGDKALVAFCEAVLQLYEEHNINGHVDWESVSNT